MAEIMKDEDFLKTVTKEELLESWRKEQEKRKEADKKIRYLESLNKDLEIELDKFQRWYYKEKKKNEHTNS